MNDAIKLRVIAYKEGDMWVGQCLEHDIGAQADTLDALYARLHLSINAEATESKARTGEVFGGIGPAPQFFFDKWEQATMKAQGPREELYDTELRLCA